MTWSTVHGISVITDNAKTGFVVDLEPTRGRVRPTANKPLRGVVYFNLPGPANPDSKAFKILLDITTNTSSVEDVQIYYGNTKYHGWDNLQKQEKFTESVPVRTQKAAPEGLGLSMVVTVNFEETTSRIDFRAVGVEFSD